MAGKALRLEDNLDSTEFAALLNETLSKDSSIVGSVVKGTIIALDKECATIDVGLKSEGRVPVQEFSRPGEDPELAVGDIVDVFVERMEDANGQSVLSRDKARREEVWVELEKSWKKKSALLVLSLTALKVALLLILAARLRSCLVHKLTSAQFAMLRL